MAVACKSCGAHIIWAKTIKGRPIPLDTLPSSLGNVVISEEGVALVYADPAGIARATQTSPTTSRTSPPARTPTSIASPECPGPTS